jgi:hypothetical protein
MTKNHDCAVGTAFANTDVSAAFSNHANTLELQTIFKRIGISLQSFSALEQFAAAFAR